MELLDESKRIHLLFSVFALNCICFSLSVSDSSAGLEWKQQNETKMEIKSWQPAFLSSALKKSSLAKKLLKLSDLSTPRATKLAVNQAISIIDGRRPRK